MTSTAAMVREAEVRTDGGRQGRRRDPAPHVSDDRSLDREHGTTDRYQAVRPLFSLEELRAR